MLLNLENIEAKGVREIEISKQKRQQELDFIVAKAKAEVESSNSIANAAKINAD